MVRNAVKMDNIDVRLLYVFVFGDVFNAQTWEVLTLKNCNELP